MGPIEPVTAVKKVTNSQPEMPKAPLHNAADVLTTSMINNAVKFLMQQAKENDERMQKANEELKKAAQGK